MATLTRKEIEQIYNAIPQTTQQNNAGAVEPTPRYSMDYVSSVYNDKPKYSMDYISQIYNDLAPQEGADVSNTSRTPSTNSSIQNSVPSEKVIEPKKEEQKITKKNVNLDLVKEAQMARQKAIDKNVKPYEREEEVKVESEKNEASDSSELAVKKLRKSVNKEPQLAKNALQVAEYGAKNNIDAKFVDRMLDPSHKLSDEEVERAKALVEKFEQTDVNENAYTTVPDANNPDGKLVPSYTVDENGNYDPSRELSDKQKEYRQKVYALKDKVYGSNAFVYGAMATTPFVGKLMENDEGMNSLIQNAKTQNPGSYVGGVGAGVAGNILANVGLQNALGATKYGDTVNKLFGVKEGANNSVVRKLLADTFMDAPVDLALDTIPELSANIATGKSGKETAIDLAKNVGLNAGLNLGAATLGNADEIGSAIRGVINNNGGLGAVKDAGEIARISDDEVANILDSLRNVTEPTEDAVKAVNGNVVDNAVEAVDEGKQIAKNEISELIDAQKPTEQIANEVPANVIDDAVEQTKPLDPYNDVNIYSEFNKIADTTGMSKSEIQFAMDDFVSDYASAIEDGKSIDEALEYAKSNIPTKEITDNNVIPTVEETPKVTEDIPVVEEIPQTDVNVPTETEIPKTDVNTPTATPVKTTDKKYSKVYTNSLSKQRTVNMQNRADQINATYDVHHKTDVINAAVDDLKRDYNLWDKHYQSGTSKITTDTDVHKAMLLMADKQKQIDDLAKSGADKNEISKLVSEKTLIARKLREAGTEAGREIKAFDYWNGTADGAIINAQIIKDKNAEKWAKRNIKDAKALEEVAKKIKSNGRLDSALSYVGNKMNGYGVANKTHEQIMNEVSASLQKEFGSIAEQFTENDVKVLANYVEENVPIPEMANAIQHRLAYGNWYSIDESLPIKDPQLNGKIKSALTNMFKDDEAVKGVEEPISHSDLVAQIKNTLDAESKSISSKFNENDYEYLANLVENGADTKSLTSMLEGRIANGTWDVSEETVQKVNDLFAEAQMYPVNSKQRVELENKAFWELANDGNPATSLAEKFNAWRYLAMLGNPKTHVRNIVGNGLFQGVTSVSNTLAAIGEEGVDKIAKRLNNGEGIARTKSVLTHKDLGLIKAARKDAEENAYRALSGSKYNDSVRSLIDQQKEAFNSKIMRGADNLNANLLDKEDFSAMKFKYQSSLAGYLKANGADESIFDAEFKLAKLKDAENVRLLTDVERAEMSDLKNQVSLLEDARAYGVKQAEYSAFHEDNKFANWLSNISSNANNSDSPALRAMGKIIEGIVPFKKTPLNIIKSGAQYSPLNHIADVNLIRKLIKGQDGVTASDVIESMSKTLTGDAMVGLGAYLYSKGTLLSSDEDTKWQDQLEGKQNYALKIGDKTFTIDFAAPSVMPLLLGAEMRKLVTSRGMENGEDYKTVSDRFWDTFTDTLQAGAKLMSPVMETSMLSGINDTLDTVASATQNQDYGSAVATLGINALTGYATQGIPTLAGQIARTIDTTRRSTYSDKGNSMARSFDKQLTKIENKTPFVSMLNEPYVDAYGRQQDNSPTNTGKKVIDFLGNAAYQFFSPGYIDTIEQTPADISARNAYENMQTPDANVFSDLPTSKKVGDERLSKEDNTKYLTTRGQAGLELRNMLANDERFNSLTPDQQAEILSEIDSFADKVGEATVNPDMETTNKAYNTYVGSNGNMEAVRDYFLDKEQDAIDESNLVNMGVPVNSTTKKLYANGNQEELNVWKDAQAKASEYGVEFGKETFDTYQNMEDNKKDKYLEYLSTAKSSEESATKNGWTAYDHGKYNEYVNDYLPEIENLGVKNSDKYFKAWDSKGINYLRSVVEEDAKNAEFNDKAISLGFTTPSGDASSSTYNDAIAVLGNNENELKAYAKWNKGFQESGKKTKANAIAKLEAQNNLSIDQMGKYLAVQQGHLSSGDMPKNVRSAFEKSHSDYTVYWLAQQLEQYGRDVDGNGKNNKDDVSALLSQYGLQNNTDYSDILEELYYSKKK